MANYKQGDITGTAWTRCSRIDISNPYGQAPLAYLYDEEALQLGERVITAPVGNLLLGVDMAASFDVYDPATAQATGDTVTYAQLYGLLYSVYRTVAAQRDALQVAVPEQGA